MSILDRYKRNPKKPDESNWNGPQSSEDMGRDKLKKDSSGLGYHKPVDISKRVDPSAARDDGFSGKLDKGPAEDA